MMSPNGSIGRVQRASAKRKVRPYVIIVAGVFRKNAPKMFFVELRVTTNHSNCRRLWPRTRNAEELLKRNRRNHEQINRRNPLHMITKEGLPSLPWPIPSRYHVDGNRGARLKARVCATLCVPKTTSV